MTSISSPFATYVWFYLSYEAKSIYTCVLSLKRQDFDIITRRYYGQHFITLPTFLIHWYIIDFISWSYITPRRDAKW